MGFGSYCHVVSPTNLKKIRFRSPCEKNHKTSLSKVKSLNGQKFSIINEKNLLNKVCSPFPLCIIIFFFGQFWGDFFVLGPSTIKQCSAKNGFGSISLTQSVFQEESENLQFFDFFYPIEKKAIKISSSKANYLTSMKPFKIDSVIKMSNVFLHQII